MSYDLACTVTGASGFVGRHLVDHLLQTDYKVRVFAVDLEPAGWAESVTDNGSRVTFHRWDVTQPLHSAFLGVDAVYHFAGIADPKKYVTRPIAVMDLNLMGLKAILEKVALWGPDVRPRVVYSSTSEVYGLNEDVPFEESALMVFGHELRWCYAMSKAVGEMYLRAYSLEHDMRHTIFRFFNFVGPDIDAPGAGRVLTQMVGDAMAKGEITVTRPGTQTRCFTHIDDAVPVLVKALTMKAWDDKGPWGCDFTVNIGNNAEVTMAYVAQLVADTLYESGYVDKRPRIEVRDGRQIYGKEYADVKRRMPLTTVAEEVFGWKPAWARYEFLPGVIRAIASRA